MEHNANSSRVSRFKKKWVVLVVLLVIGISFCLFYLYPAIRKSYLLACRLRCGANLKMLGGAVRTYASDNEGKFPTKDRWCDLVIQGGYAPEEWFRCPFSKIKSGQCTYAMNANLNGKRVSDVPADTVMLFEGQVGWNQTGGVEMWNTAKKHGRGNHVVYVGGFVAFILTDSIEKEKWQTDANTTETK